MSKILSGYDQLGQQCSDDLIISTSLILLLVDFLAQEINEKTYKKLIQKVLLHFYPCMGTYVHHAKYQEGFRGFKNTIFSKSPPFWWKKVNSKGDSLKKWYVFLESWNPPWYLVWWKYRLDGWNGPKSVWQLPLDENTLLWQLPLAKILAQKIYKVRAS